MRYTITEQYEAIQFTGENTDEIRRFLDSSAYSLADVYRGDWLVRAVDGGGVRIHSVYTDAEFREKFSPADATDETPETPARDVPGILQTDLEKWQAGEITRLRAENEALSAVANTIKVGPIEEVRKRCADAEKELVGCKELMRRFPFLPGGTCYTMTTAGAPKTVYITRRTVDRISKTGVYFGSSFYSWADVYASVEEAKNAVQFLIDPGESDDASPDLSYGVKVK